MISSNSPGRRGGKKRLNFDLNLVPFIDVLSTCICFLLVTAVFLNLGSLHVRQAVGDESVSEAKKTGSVQVSLGSDGDIKFFVADLQGMGGHKETTIVRGESGTISFAKTEKWIQNFAKRFPQIKTVLIMPNPKSKYDDLIQLMAQFKQVSMDQIGVTPL
ncbi:MAG: ExbD/TolR family protein [Bdellovibrionales bacterium]